MALARLPRSSRSSIFSLPAGGSCGGGWLVGSCSHWPLRPPSPSRAWSCWEARIRIGTSPIPSSRWREPFITDSSGFSSESHRLRLSLQLSDFFYYVSESKSRAFGGILNRLPFLLSKKWEAVHIQVHLFFYHLSNMGKYA